MVLASHFWPVRGQRGLLAVFTNRSTGSDGIVNQTHLMDIVELTLLHVSEY